MRNKILYYLSGVLFLIGAIMRITLLIGSFDWDWLFQAIALISLCGTFFLRGRIKALNIASSSLLAFSMAYHLYYWLDVKANFNGLYLSSNRIALLVINGHLFNGVQFLVMAICMLAIFFLHTKNKIVDKNGWVASALCLLVSIINGIAIGNKLGGSFNLIDLWGLNDIAFVTSIAALLGLLAISVEHGGLIRTVSKDTSAAVNTRERSLDIDKLYSLKALLDAGAITQEDFEEKKRQMIDT